YKHGAPGTIFIQNEDKSTLVVRGAENNFNEKIEVDSLANDHSLLVENVHFQLDASDHQFVDTELRNNGVLTIATAGGVSNHGITLAADKITIDASSKIDVSGKGVVGDGAAGIYTGGSHGGRGGDYSANLQSGLSYGSYREPVTLAGVGRGNPGTVDARGG